MRLKVGDKVPSFILKSINGEMIDDQMMLKKRYLLSFYRYASCPFCNLRVSFLMDLHDSLSLNNQFIGVFQSTEEDMNQYVYNQKPKFPICSDYDRVYYKKFGIETSTVAYIRGALKLKTLFLAFKKGFKISKSMGPKNTVPADFLVDEMGFIQRAYYGKDISDHLDLNDVCVFFEV